MLLFHTKIEDSIFLGQIVDRSPRLRMAVMFLVFQNISIALTCGLLIYFFGVHKIIKTIQKKKNWMGKVSKGPPQSLDREGGEV